MVSMALGGMTENRRLEMANYTEQTVLSASRFVNTASRYYDSRVVYYTENKLLTFNLYKKTEIPLSSNDKYLVVSSGQEYRPDLISKMAYGAVDFWWRIMEANGIKDVFDIKIGLNLRIPQPGLK